MANNPEQTDQSISAEFLLQDETTRMLHLTKNRLVMVNEQLPHIDVTPIMSRLISVTMNQPNVEITLAQLKDEVIRAEMGGAGAYQGAPVANYAVRTTVTGASFGAEFKEASRWTDDDGKTHVTPASCNYASRVGVSVDVYTVPELKRVKSLRGTGTQSASEDARNSNCNKGGPGLVRGAAEDAIYEIQEDLKAFFAPTGYVLHGFETSEGKYILKTSLTKGIGAEAGKGVRIVNVTEEGDRYPVGEGKIAKPLVNSGAFVVVDEEVISRVRIGDEVRVDHSCSIMGCKLDKTLGMK
jgi:hypothetical protein